MDRAARCSYTSVGSWGQTSTSPVRQGRDYLDESIFEAARVEVRYHEFRHPTYPQFGRTDFTSHLSTLDLLSNCGQDSLSIIRQGSTSASG